MSAIKFLEAYQKEDLSFFFGREKETELLYEKVRKSRLTLLYGLSGTGKTSLARCGLSNKFHETDWYELYIRRGKHILSSMRELIDDHSETILRGQTSHLEALNTLYLDYFRPIYLIFDQFEELFISGDQNELDDFMDFLSELLNNEELNCRVILIMREEYFTRLDQFENKIPIIYDSRLRLERMSKRTLKEVIKGIAENENIRLKEEDKTISMILENISDENGSVDLPYLQVYLDKLCNNENLKIDDNGNRTLTPAFIESTGTLDDILGTFLEEQLETIAANMSKGKSGLNLEKAKELAWNIMKSMITMEGTKKPISYDELSLRLEQDD